MPGGATIDGVYYPAGTNVGVSTCAIHHSEESFLEPFSFRPERWIAGSDTGFSEESVTAAQAAFCPFSLGTRGCIGKGLVYMEMTTAVARLLWLYDVRGVEGDRTGEGALVPGWAGSGKASTKSRISSSQREMGRWWSLGLGRGKLVGSPQREGEGRT
jgi:hypothetical protein